MDSSKKTLAIIVVLLTITAGLVYIDYSSGQKGSSGLFSSAIRGILTPSVITPELITKAGFDAQTLIEQPSTNAFFAPYLKLPEGTEASLFTLEGTISISEINKVDNAFETLDFLTKQTNPAYTFNVINGGSTFYLNQTGTKTHNYLAIIINNVLYGFQYPVARHPDILRLIDSIQNNQ